MVAFVLSMKLARVAIPVFIGCSLIFIVQPARAATNFGFNISLDGNVFFNQVKNTINELVQAFTNATKPGPFAASQLDIVDTPSDFRFNLSGISAIIRDESYALNYSGDSWKTSGSLMAERNKNCSGNAIPNCVISIFPPTFVDSETAFLKVASAQVIHFNNNPINQLENVNHGLPPILAVGPIVFQAADNAISQDGGFKTINKYGNFGVAGTHSPHRDSADAFFDQILVQRTPVGDFPEIVDDADYEIIGFTYTVSAKHSTTITPVPGPLPLLGVGVALRYSRKIRRKIRSLR